MNVFALYYSLIQKNFCAFSADRDMDKRKVQAAPREADGNIQCV